MSSINTLTGRQGKVVVGSRKIRRITNWSVNPTLATSTEWGDSDCGGFTARAPGRWDCTFTVEGKFDTTSGGAVYDEFQPGVFTASNGNVDVTEDAPSTYNFAEVVLWLEHETNDVPAGTLNNRYWHFPRALCTDFTLTVDVDTEEVIGWTSSWGSDGIFYWPGQVAASPVGGVEASPTDENIPD